MALGSLTIRCRITGKNMQEFIKSIPVPVFVIAYSLMYTLGEVFSKFWANTGSLFNLLIAFCTYCVGTFIWLMLMLNTNELGRMGYLIIAQGTLVTFLLSYFIFSERMSTTQYVGVVLAAISVWLLSM
jgi:drug/metabolite transporter (DMT)-like permease